MQIVCFGTQQLPLLKIDRALAEQVVGDALRNIHMKQGNVKFLGSYPSAYGSAEIQEANRDGVSSADTWLADIRSRIR